MITYDDKLQPGDVVALGDIHGTWNLFEQFLEWVEGTQATVVLLGDMIDRGGQDLEVLRATKQLLDEPEHRGLQSFYALMGNHERMFLNALDDPSSYVLWVQNGGNYDQVGEIEREHKEWIRELPLYMTIADTLFIHAGIYPGHDPAESIAEGRGDALLWIRQPFLTYEPEFEGWNPRLKKVVHGHTPTIFEEPPQDYIPVVAGQRVNIDTGAYSKPRGRLTAYNVTQNTFHQFSR